MAAVEKGDLNDILKDMLQAGTAANYWLEHALVNCVPTELFEEWKGKIVFLSASGSDAFRVAKVLRENGELIFLSERIIPKGALSEDDPRVRYFLFAALHEVVHVIKQHKPPNEISKEENDAQEAEANDTALEWYNDYVRCLKNPHLGELTKQEIASIQEHNQQAMLASG